MDESSSKFVDRLAIEKLLQEKIAAFHHHPPKVDGQFFQSAFTQMGGPLAPFGEVTVSDDGTTATLSSPVVDTYPENRTIPVRTFSAKSAKGAVLIVHGLFEDNRAMYGFFIKELNRLGYTVYMTTLPYHHERMPSASNYSGEFFLSGDLLRTKHAFIQGVIEVRFIFSWLRNQTDLPLYLAGFSMGGTVSLAAFSVDDTIPGLAVANPAAVLSEVVWNSPLCEPIKRDLLDGGWRKSDIDNILASFDPFVFPASDRYSRGALLIYGLFDQITRRKQYESLIDKLQFSNVIKYKAGHLNTLRVPRFAMDLVQFFDTLSSGYASSTTE